MFILPILFNNVKCTAIRKQPYQRDHNFNKVSIKSHNLNLLRFVGIFYSLNDNISDIVIEKIRYSIFINISIFVPSKMK